MAKIKKKKKKEKTSREEESSSVYYIMIHSNLDCYIMLNLGHSIKKPGKYLSSIKFISG